ncbi:MAG: citrate lyase subunit gamma [Thermoplasmatota archaeon]
MTEIKREVTVGTDNKEDVVLTLSPVQEGSGISIEVSGKGARQFGDEIKAAVRAALQDMNVSDAAVQVQDNWAYDFTVRARIKAAVLKARED